MWRRIASALVLASLAAVGGATGASSPVQGPTASAKALAIRIVLPGGRVVGSPAADGTAGTSPATAPSFAYPVSGSVIVTGSIRASADTHIAKTATAGASSAASNISIFEGEITADSASAGTSASTNAGRAGGAFQGTGVVHLQALGRPHAYGRAALADWGTLTIARHAVDRTAPAGTRGYEGTAIAIDVVLTAPHGGLPAGSEIQVGYVTAGARTAPPVIPETGPRPGDRPQLLPPPNGPLIGMPQVTTPALTATPYVYPVFGATTVTDGYGGPKHGGGYEHGADIYGRLGQPLVAVSEGTLYSVGWNRAAGNRLWLRDRQGNEFLYTHLSAFSTLASNGAHVRAGQVIGFMGATGSSAGPRTRLHFEVHPVSMLFLGSGGAVDPGSYLGSWRHVASLVFPVATGWTPKVSGTANAPTPGAVLIGVADISTADGLDPASLRRAVRPKANG